MGVNTKELGGNCVREKIEEIKKGPLSQSLF